MPEIVREEYGQKSRTLIVYGKISKSDKKIPQIRFEGQWLKALGFLAGDKICPSAKICRNYQLFYFR